MVTAVTAAGAEAAGVGDAAGAVVGGVEGAVEVIAAGRVTARGETGTIGAVATRVAR